MHDKIDMLRGCNPLVPEIPIHLLTFSYHAYSMEEENTLINNLSNHYKFPAQKILLHNGSSRILESIFINTYETTYFLSKDFFLNYDLAKFHNHKTIAIPRHDCIDYLLQKIDGLTNDSKVLILLTIVSGYDGSFIKPHEIVRLSTALKEKSPLSSIVIDGAYAEFVGLTLHDYSVFIHLDNVSYIGTFSKAYGIAGYRVGYMLYNHTMMELYYKMVFSVSRIGAAIANYLLTDQCFLQKTIQFTQQEKKFFCENNQRCINSMGNRINYLETDSEKLYEFLLNKGFWVRPIAYNNNIDNAISFSIDTHHNNTQLLALLEDWESKKH